MSNNNITITKIQFEKTIYLTKLQCNKIKYHQDRILLTPLIILSCKILINIL